MRTSVARGFRLGVVAVMALMLALAGMFTAGAGAARADVPPGGVTHVFMNIGPGPSGSQRSQYRQLIDSLRNAAGHNFRDSVMETQRDDVGLIRLTLTVLPDGNVPQATATLWITPQNLYVQGYSDNIGHTFVFPDTPANVRSRIAMAAQRSTGQLTFASTYNRLVQAAGRGREAMPISFQELRQSTLALANQRIGGNPSRDNQREVARALMFMIQFTSEAARIKDVFETMASPLQTSQNDRNGLPPFQQELENDWSRISAYGLNVTQFPTTPPVDVGGQVGTLHNFEDVARRLAMVLSTATSRAPIGPNREEL